MSVRRSAVMEPFTRHEALCRLDRQIVGPMERLEAERADMASSYDIGKLLSDHGALDPSAASGDDLLKVNVGGSHSSVRRKHLTSVEGTLLAVLFGGRWDGRLGRDADNRVFVDVCPRAFDAMLEAILDGQGAVDRLMDEAKTRNYQGLHDFWTAVLLSPIDKPSTDASSAAQGHSEEPTVASHGLPAELRGVVAEVESFVKTFVAKKNDLDSERAAKKAAYDQTMMEITAVKPFLAPLSGGDAIRSVDVCGQTVSTTQSTLDVMGDIALTNRFNLWPAPIEDVPVDHVRRLVDHYRRKRHAASLPDTKLMGGVRMPLVMDSAPRQETFNKTAAMYGVDTQSSPHGRGGGAVFTEMQSGIRYQVVRPVSGPKATRDQRVKIDVIEWRDDFDGPGKRGEERGLVARVSDQPEWAQEVFTDMRVGEVRRIILPARLSVTGKEAYIEYRLVAIL
ncbi:unnamed protein product [Vitrella brassicaformis CCMP3155]|uniref:Potassium channel tetramerisation-type BTB domain-containing protein n=1 Tax=Vitrella brassicaformis (strain CCMP3155) TaxID=1169540 RepID=A0A0G4GPP8_VITBC|nr:unnamed protein product [Vitrella brassicaformis CCMP3155]|eukprot:CEM32329.1 unnamed protein product [Vitrella brassicaformis CCMP3155]